MRGTKSSIVALAALMLGSAAGYATAGCATTTDAKATARILSREAACTLKRLRSGPTARCRETDTPPACADTLVEDVLLLAFGPNVDPESAVDRRTLRAQLRCQKAIGLGAARYVGTRLKGLVRGRPLDAVAAQAAKRLRKVTKRCAVAPLRDTGGITLPATGVQCAAALGDPTDADALAGCLDTLLGIWSDRVGPAPTPLRPNVVIVLTDDQRWDTTDGTHSPGGAFVMPYTRDALADHGVDLPNAFITTPVCCPSRASILSGQYAHHSGVLTNVGTDGGADDFDDTSAVGLWLQAAGYRTGFYGKYMNGYVDLWDATAGEPPYVPPGWNEWHAFERPRYFDYTLVDRSDGGPVGTSYYGFAEEEYSTDVLRRLAVEFIESTPSGQPFFLHLNLKAPHTPRTPAPRHERTFEHFPDWRPPSHNEEDVSDKPAWVQALPLIEGADLRVLDRTRRRQLEMLQAVDEAIDGPEIFGTKSIMQALRDAGVADDTIVIFISDNGWLWGEHRMDKKNKPYEEAIRTPLLVRYPKLTPLPRTEDRFALNIDLAPTLVELAGATVSPPIVQDGASLVRLLDGTTRDWRTDFMTEGWPNGHVWATVREARWKYTELPVTPGDPATEFERELYDLENDPYELESLHAAPEHADRIAAMAARLREIRPTWPGDSAGLDVDEDE